MERAVGELGAQESKLYCPSIHMEILTFSPSKNSKSEFSSPQSGWALTVTEVALCGITELAIGGDVPATTGEVVCLAAITNKNGR